MNTWELAIKVSLPKQCLLAGIGAWIIALISNGPEWLNQPKIAVAFCAAFSCLGSSLFHYGMRREMYAKKWWDPVVIKKPIILLALRASIFVISILIVMIFVGAACAVVAAGNFVIIALYGKVLDRIWPIKNITAAMVCVSPIIMGWLAGNRLNPIIPSLILGTLCVYLGREGIKDTEDIEANRGIRFTLPMMMGKLAAMRVAGWCLLASVVFYLQVALKIPEHPIMPFLLILSAICLFALLASRLIFASKLKVKYQNLDLGILLLMAAILGMKGGLP